MESSHKRPALLDVPDAGERPPGSIIDTVTSWPPGRDGRPYPPQRSVGIRKSDAPCIAGDSGPHLVAGHGTARNVCLGSRLPLGSFHSALDPCFIIHSCPCLSGSSGCHKPPWALALTKRAAGAGGTVTRLRRQEPWPAKTSSSGACAAFSPVQYPTQARGRPPGAEFPGHISASARPSPSKPAFEPA